LNTGLCEKSILEEGRSPESRNSSAWGPMVWKKRKPDKHNVTSTPAIINQRIQGRGPGLGV